MFERFTDRARRATVLSQESARTAPCAYIDLTHLLAGLAADDGGIGAAVLHEAGITAALVQKHVSTTTTCPAGHIPFTELTKKALELSLREALQLGHNYIGTEHVLLGVVRAVTGAEGSDVDGVAAKRVVAILATHGLTLAETRKQVVAKLTEGDKLKPPKVDPPSGSFVGRIVSVDFEHDPPRLTVDLLSNQPVGAWTFYGLQVPSSALGDATERETRT